MNFKNIEIGFLIASRVEEYKIEMSRICNFFKLSQKDIEEMYGCKSLDTEVLLKWSKLLEYDFFRIYSHHLILYAPQGNMQYRNVSTKNSRLPQFRKNIYTKEIINFILELIEKGDKTRQQVINEYKIPKSTLFKWIDKNQKDEKA